MASALDGTVSFLISDIEGSTRRWAENPAMAEALTRHDEILRSAIERSDGRWVKHTGDGVLAVFGQASNALDAALLELWEQSGRSIREQWVVWSAIRRGMWDLADEVIDGQDAEFRGRHRVQMLMPRAVLRWMQGQFDEAEADFDEVPTHGPIRRWHHDYYPSRAEVAAMRGDNEATKQWVLRHFEVPVEPAEEVMRIAGMRALAMAEVDTGDIDAAVEVVKRMRSISDQHSPARTPAVQIGSTEFHIAAAEAELTRLTSPDPVAWSRAENLTSFVYWTLYCRVRRLEASVALGDDVSGEVTSTRAEADSLGAGGLIALLDSFTPPD